MAGAITIGLDPLLELGPVTLAWHGIMTAVGIVVGGWSRWRGPRCLLAYRSTSAGHVRELSFSDVTYAAHR